MSVLLIAVAVLVFLIIIIFLLLFNRMIRLRNKVDNAWHQIDVELSRRHDLVPELTEVVKGYASHERGVFERAAQARAGAVAAPSVGERGPAEDNLTGAVGNLIAVAEGYPELKANSDFLKFQKQLSETETRIAGSRKYYNGSVMQYNNARESFPGNIVAKVFAGSFAPREYFEITDPEDRQAPGV